MCDGYARVPSGAARTKWQCGPPPNPCSLRFSDGCADTVTGSARTTISASTTVSLRIANSFSCPPSTTAAFPAPGGYGRVRGPDLRTVCDPLSAYAFGADVCPTWNDEAGGSLRRPHSIAWSPGQELGLSTPVYSKMYRP